MLLHPFCLLVFLQFYSLLLPSEPPGRDLINFILCGLCRSSPFSVILACPESFPESFRDRKDSRQAGMTLKTNIQFLTPLRSLPQGIYILSLGDLEIATNNILSPVEKCFVKCHCPSEIL